MLIVANGYIACFDIGAHGVERKREREQFGEGARECAGPVLLEHVYDELLVPGLPVRGGEPVDECVRDAVLGLAVDQAEPGHAARPDVRRQPVVPSARRIDAVSASSRIVVARALHV